MSWIQFAAHLFSCLFMFLSRNCVCAANEYVWLLIPFVRSRNKRISFFLNFIYGKKSKCIHFSLSMSTNAEKSITLERWFLESETKTKRSSIVEMIYFHQINQIDFFNSLGVYKLWLLSVECEKNNIFFLSTKDNIEIIQQNCINKAVIFSCCVSVNWSPSASS